MAARRSIPLARIANRLFDTPLAIHPSKFEVLVSVLGPRLALDPSVNFDAQVDLSEKEAKDLLSGKVITGGVTRPDGTFLAFADDEDDQPSVGGRKAYKVTDDGVAIINVCGTLTEKSAWYHAYSGMTSYESIGKQVAECDADANIRAILLNCNTPGGETHGLFDLADKLYSRRGTKPMYGIAKNAALSAGYAIISACDKVFVTRTGALGSIGVLAGHVDQSAMDQKNGLKFTYIHAGEKKVDGNPHEPLSKSAKSDAQAEVDREYEMFVNLVSRNRNISADKVRATEAGVLFADNSLPLLGDAVGTFDDAYLAVAQKGGIVIPVTRGTNPADLVSSSRGKKSGKASSEAEAMFKIGAMNETDRKAVEASVAAMKPEEAKKLHGQLILTNLADAQFMDLLSKRAEASSEPCDPDQDELDAKKKAEEAEAKAKAAQIAIDAKAIADAKLAADAAVIADLKKVEGNKAMDSILLQIAGMCELAGRNDLIASYQKKALDEKSPLSLQQIQDDLLEKRAKGDANSGRIASHAPPVSTSALDKMMTAVRTHIVGSKAKGPQAVAEAYHAVLSANPELYAAYNDERADAVSGKPSEARAYRAELVQRLTIGGRIPELIRTANDPGLQPQA